MTRITGSLQRLFQKLSGYPAAPLLTASLLGFILWNLPIVPSSSEVDLSLIDVLNYAHQKHLQFGPEITSTYGPLGWLYFPYYSQSSGLLQLYAQLLLSLTALAGCCLVAWRLSILWRSVILLMFTWAGVNMSYRADLLVEAGLLCWALLCLVERDRRLLVALTVLTLFAAFASLAKISFFFIAAGTVGYLVIDLALRDRRPVTPPSLSAPALAVTLLLGFIGLFLLGWLVSRQNLLHLPSFLIHALFTVQSYNQALGLEGLVSLRFLAFLSTILLLILIAVRSLSAFDSSVAHWRLRRIMLFLWLSLFTFIGWKHGFVRLDTFHPPLFLGLSLVIACATQMLANRRLSSAVLLTEVDALDARADDSGRPLPKGEGRGEGEGIVRQPLVSVLHCSSTVLASVCLLFSTALLQTFFFSSVLGSLTQPFREFGYRLNPLFHPLDFNRQLSQVRKGIHEEYQLPQCRPLIGKDSIDVFGQYQSYAIDNDLIYRPRPVFQSYNACNKPLMALNQNYYLSNPPKFVLFDLKAMDDKFPPLEDAWLLRHLLLNYEPVAQENRFVLLRAVSSEPCRMSLLGEERISFGERINLQKYGETPLWLEIELSPNVRGWLRNSLYAPPVIRVGVWDERGNLVIKRRAPASMLSAGFLASPLLLRTEDLSKLLAAQTALRLAAYSVEAAPGQESLWQPVFRCRIYKIDNPIPAHAGLAGSIYLAGSTYTGNDAVPTHPPQAAKINPSNNATKPHKAPDATP